MISQVAATAVGVPPERLKIVTGDTEHTPYGGGTWASRAAGIGGEAVAQAGRALRQQILRAAAVMLQEEAENLDIRDGVVVDRATGVERIGLDEVGRICYYRPDTLPDGFQSELVATRHYVPRKYPFAFTNGAQASYLEVDVETGFISLLDHWCIEDCGTVINPLLVDEQIRGGIVQELAERKLEIEHLKLQQGLSSSFQVGRFEEDLVNAQRRELDAVVGYRSALDSLDRTLGTTLDRWGVSVERVGR